MNGTAGNISNQKYEMILKNKKLQKVLNGDVKPSKHILFTKQSQPIIVTSNENRQQKLLNKQKEIDKETEKYQKNIEKILNDKRVTYAGGCDGTGNNHATNTASVPENFQKLHNREIELARQRKKIESENERLKNIINNVTSTIKPLSFIKEYEYKEKLGPKKMSSGTLHLNLLHSLKDHKLSVNRKCQSSSGFTKPIKPLPDESESSVTAKSQSSSGQRKPPTKPEKDFVF